MHRRSVLRHLAVGGVSLALPTLSARAAAMRGSERSPSLIVLWMNGGMSQLETWDPHPDSPGGGEVTRIPTTIPDISISSLLPQMAEQMQDCLLIRSLTSEEGDHERGAAFVRSGYRPEAGIVYPTLGAVTAHRKPVPSLDLPPYISLSPVINTPEGGYLGAAANAWRVYKPGGNLNNLNAAVSEERLDRRLQGLNLLADRFTRNRTLAVEKTLHDRMIQRSIDMMQSEQLQAFELDTEPHAVRARYGDTQFGRGCLLARRLVESGVRTVEVTLPGFDTHIANHEGHITQCEILDPAMSALISDLRDRDLLQSTIVLCISEFGRTPKINPTGGRDHWPAWFSCVVAGGGFRSGTVIGETPPGIPTQERPRPVQPVTVPELYATVLSRLHIDPAEEVFTPLGRPIKIASALPRTDLLGPAFQ